MIYALLALFGIGLLIFIHELGHFLAARSIGVRVDVFSLGFGPRLIGFRRGPTDYRISVVPLGGYVQVAGQDPMDPRYGDDDALGNRSVGKRFWFFSAGVLMNLLFAMVVFPFAFNAGVEFTAPVIGSVQPGGPAWRAGVEPGDEVLRLNGKEMYSFENMRVEAALSGSEPIQLELLRDGEKFSVQVDAAYDETRGLYMIGVAPSMAEQFKSITFESGASEESTGLQATDVLVAIDGERVTPDTAQEKLQRLQGGYRDGRISLTVQRGDERVTRDLTTRTVELPVARLGVTQGRRTVLGLRPDPAIQALGLKDGDQVIAVDGVPYPGTDWEDALMAEEGQLTLRICRFPETGDQKTRISQLQTMELTSDAPGIRALLSTHVAMGRDRLLPALIPQAGSPAEAAGLLPGDVPVALQGIPLQSWSDLLEALQQDRDKDAALTLQVERAGTEGPLSLEIQPAYELHLLGLVFEADYTRRVFQVDGFSASLKTGFVATGDLIKQLYVTLKGMFTGQVGANNLGGIITISVLSYDMAQWGLPRFFYFLALLSINLAVINLLPIPVLDGGHLLFLAVEKVRGAPVPERMFQYGQVLGLVLVLALVVFTFYNDLARYL